MSVNGFVLRSFAWTIGLAGTAWLALFHVARAQAEREDASRCREVIIPDRPTATFSTLAHHEGCSLVETSLQGSFSSENVGISAPTTLRYGVGAGWEARLDGGVFDLSFPESGATELAAAPLFVGMKGELLGQDGALPALGILPGVSFPLGDQPGPGMSPLLWLLADWTLSSHLQWTVNFGGSVEPGLQSDHILRLPFATSLTLAIPGTDGAFGAFVDSFGVVPIADEDEYRQDVGLGALWWPDAMLQLDAFVRVDVAADTRAFTAGAGIALRP